MEEKEEETAVEEKAEEYQNHLGARVLWPADMPDDILEVTHPDFPHVSFSL